MPGTYSIAKYGRPPSVVPASMMCAMLGMAHQRERLPLELEARDDLARVHARLDDLERDAPADRHRLFGEIHLAHGAFADALEQAVGADLPFVGQRRW